MAEKFLITFKPIGRFYFGTSRSFAEGFFTRSSHFPPQTSLLGALRYTLLKQNNLLDDKNRYPKKNGSKVLDEVKELTGEAAMKSIDEKVKNKNYFGILKKISPVFICQQISSDPFPKNFFFPVPFDVIYKRDENNRDESGEKKIIGLERIVFNPLSGNIETYTTKRTKEFSAESLGNNLFWDAYFNNKNLDLKYSLRHKDVFVDDSQPGIERDNNRTTVKERYYIKKDFRMHNDFSFGIIVHFSETPKLTNDDVFLGGERSLFRMTLTKIDQHNTGVLENHPVIKRFLDENKFGDFDGDKNVSFENGSALVYLSPFFGEGKIEGADHSIVNEIFSPRMIGDDARKTNTFNVIPSRSIIYTKGMLKIGKTFSMPKLIGYNFAIKFSRGDK